MEGRIIIVKSEKEQNQLEKEVFGCLLHPRNSDALFESLELINVKDFYCRRHQVIYASILDCIIKNNSVDLLMLASELQKAGELENIGGSCYLTELQDTVSSPEGVLFRLRYLKEKSKIRELDAVCLMTLNKIKAADYDDVFDLIDNHANSLYEIQNIPAQKKVNVEKIADEIIEHAKEIKPGGVYGFSWGLSKLDYLTSGIEIGKTYVVGGTKKSGKTKFVINTIYALKNKDVSVQFLSLEMGPEAVVTELLSRISFKEN
jgi:replicative DNA helicase